MITVALMERLFPTKGLNPKKFNLVRDRAKLVETLNRILPKYGINTHKRISAFLGNCGIETDYFRTTTEYASGAAYEGRAGLGNTVSGDGRRFKGRGLTQTTGRFNYARVNETVGKKLGIDFLRHPERLAEVEIAVESACVFWDDHNLNAFADRGEFKQLSGLVNRGDKNKLALHWEKRSALYAKCKEALPLDFTIALEPADIAALPPVDQTLPSQPSDVAPAETDDFLSTALDKNVSSDDVRALARENAPTLMKTLARPAIYLFALLEAGNVYAWLGVSVAALFIIIELYIHRAKLRKLWEKLKAKFTS